MFKAFTYRIWILKLTFCPEPTLGLLFSSAVETLEIVKQVSMSGGILIMFSQEERFGMFLKIYLFIYLKLFVWVSAWGCVYVRQCRTQVTGQDGSASIVQGTNLSSSTWVVILLLTAEPAISPVPNFNSSSEFLMEYNDQIKNINVQIERTL